jgi:hypothetical protein
MSVQSSFGMSAVKESNGRWWWEVRIDGMPHGGGSDPSASAAAQAAFNHVRDMEALEPVEDQA